MIKSISSNEVLFKIKILRTYFSIMMIHNKPFLLFLTQTYGGPAFVLGLEGGEEEGPSEARLGVRGAGGPRQTPGGTQQGLCWCTYLVQDNILGFTSQHLIHYLPASPALLFPTSFEIIHDPDFKMVMLINKYSGTFCWEGSKKKKIYTVWARIPKAHDLAMSEAYKN